MQSPDLNSPQIGWIGDGVDQWLVAGDRYLQLTARQTAHSAVPAVAARRIHAIHARANGRLIGGAEARVALRARSQGELKISLQVGADYLHRVHPAIEPHRNRF